jgi:xanthine dehydrogenase accessory factor
MEDVLQEVVAMRRQGGRGALASLVESSGSIPMSERAKMLVRDDGSVAGTIGGGCLEAEILNVGREVLSNGRAHTTRYTMTEKQAGESGLNCGGTVRIYTEPIEPDTEPDLFAAVVESKSRRRECVMATVLASQKLPDRESNKLLLFPDGNRLGRLDVDGLNERVEQWAGEVLQREKPRVFNLREETLGLDLPSREALGVARFEGFEVYLEPFMPPPVLYVFGGGHVGAQICSLAKNSGFYVVVIDDRPLFANPERHPRADECVAAEIEEVFEQLPFDDQTYVVAATRGHQHDETVVELAIRTPARYIGMLGSERKKLILWDRIEGRGGDRSRLEQVYAPIGFNIGADTPEEIGISVVAELIEVRRGRVKEWKTKRAGA